MTALWHFGELVDDIGHPSTLEVSPTLGDALAPKKQGRKQGEHDHCGTHGGGTLGSWRWTLVLALGEASIGERPVAIAYAKPSNYGMVERESSASAGWHGHHKLKLSYAWWSWRPRRWHVEPLPMLRKRC